MAEQYLAVSIRAIRAESSDKLTLPIVTIINPGFPKDNARQERAPGQENSLISETDAAGQWQLFQFWKSAKLVPNCILLREAKVSFLG